MEIKLTKLSDITPYYNNPRENRNAIQPVIESIKRFGFIKPIVVDKNGVIIVGHTRYIASFQLGLEEVPVVFADIDKELANQYRIADNKLAEKSVFDEDELIEELKAMKMPNEMQAFFFEDINNLINFSYDSITVKQPTSASFIPDDDETSQQHQTPEEENPFAEYVKCNEDSGEDDEQDITQDLYKVKIVDGKRTMKVYCPYCKGIETITLD